MKIEIILNKQKNNIYKIYNKFYTENKKIKDFNWKFYKY